MAKRGPLQERTRLVRLNELQIHTVPQGTDKAKVKHGKPPLRSG